MYWVHLTVGKTKHHAKTQNPKYRTGESLIDEEDILIQELESIFSNTSIDQVLSIVRDRLEKEAVLGEYNKDGGFNKDLWF